MTTDIRFYRASELHGFLSNLYVCPVAFEDRVFRSAEDAYQYGKPKNPTVSEWLIAAPSPSLCAQAAHALLRWQVRADWSDIKVERMHAVVRAKFHQHPELSAQLIATGDARLIEASRTDAFRGVGKRGTGKNRLDQLLMEVRAELSRGMPCRKRVHELAHRR